MSLSFDPRMPYLAGKFSVKSADGKEMEVYPASYLESFIQTFYVRWRELSNEIDSAGITYTGTAPISVSGTAITTSMATNKLIGRGSASTGVMEEITLGTGLSLTGTTLNASGGNPTVSSVAYSASLSLDWTSADEIRVGALTGNIDITGMTNMTDGKRYVLKLLQDGTGGRTVTISSANVRYSEDIPSLFYSQTASKATLIGFRYDGTDSKADVVAIVAGY